MKGNSITLFNPEEIKRKAKALLALSNGIAFHLIVNPDSVNLKNKKLRLQIRSMILCILRI
jgi:phosphotransferase system IIB component